MAHPLTWLIVFEGWRRWTLCLSGTPLLLLVVVLLLLQRRATRRSATYESTDTD